MATDLVQPGIYNIEYFSGAQVAVYIGDVWVDEIVSLSYSCRQNKSPIYGYASTLFDAMSKGQVIVQGSFTINFKEAGYLWLILNHWQEMLGSPNKLRPITSSQDIERKNIERFIDGETDTFADRNQLLSNLAAQSALTGFASNKRLSGTVGATKGLGRAENAFEDFENLLWQASQQEIEELDRRADDPDLNGFDLYIAFGDFAGDDRYNHTVQKLSNVHIVGSSKVINADGTPVLEQYDFIARNQV